MKKMKKNLSKIFVYLILVVLAGCSSDNDSPNTDAGSETLGTFSGNIQVTNNPQTAFGYIYNAKVTVIKSGNNATIKVKGDLNVDREYTGTVDSNVNGAYAYVITIKKQVKPSAKNATDIAIITNNELTISIGVANDSETVKINPTSTNSIVIAGKLQMIGTGMIKD